LNAFEASDATSEIFDYELLLFKQMESGMDEDGDLNH